MQPCDLILSDLSSAFGLRVHDIAPVFGGWLNQKWRLSSDHGDLLLKQYSPVRFDRRKLGKIEQALSGQILLHDMGVPCPRIWRQGDTVLRTPGGDVTYMVMDFMPGHVESPESVSLPQMESLGEATARMHEAFSRLPAGQTACPPPDPDRIVDALHETVRLGLENCPEDAPETYREAIALISPLAARASAALLRAIPASPAHEDFTRDNMLFSGNALSAILDFDRSCVSYPLHDVGRILLSLALQDGSVNADRVSAFQRGYTRLRPLSSRDISNAFLLCWHIEIPWWIQPASFRDPSPKVARFVQEMFYLTSNYSDFL